MRESRQTEQEESKVEVLQVKREPEEFIDALPKNSVFFCCKCFQYVFEIEKRRHYPDCKDIVNLNETRNELFQTMADRRIKNIVELARYTKTRTSEMEHLYKLYQEGELEKLPKPSFPAADFFTL